MSQLVIKAERYYRRYRELPCLLVNGRLGEYRYYDMDQAIARAQVLAKRLLGRSGTRPCSMGVKPAPAHLSLLSPQL
jgi:hypothetical protein